jgi:hypothetical protein
MQAEMFATHIVGGLHGVTEVTTITTTKDQG